MKDVEGNNETRPSDGAGMVDVWVSKYLTKEWTSLTEMKRKGNGQSYFSANRRSK